MKEHEEHIDTSNMTEAELTFHYFNMFDSDKNGKLDGLELFKTQFHIHDEMNSKEHRIFLDEELQDMVDPILANDDKNNDGFLDFREFSISIY